MPNTNNPVPLPVKEPVKNDPPPDPGGNGSGFQLQPIASIEEPAPVEEDGETANG